MLESDSLHFLYLTAFVRCLHNINVITLVPGVFLENFFSVSENDQGEATRFRRFGRLCLFHTESEKLSKTSGTRA